MRRLLPSSNPPSSSAQEREPKLLIVLTTLLLLHPSCVSVVHLPLLALLRLPVPINRLSILVFIQPTRDTPHPLSPSRRGQIIDRSSVISKRREEGYSGKHETTDTSCVRLSPKRAMFSDGTLIDRQTRIYRLNSKSKLPGTVHMV